MKEKDELKMVFKNIDTVYPNIDLESAVLQRIQQQTKVKEQIEKNRKYGLIGIFTSIILIVVFALMFNSPSLSISFNEPMIQLVMCAFVLILLFLQLEATSKNSNRSDLSH